MKRYFLPVLVLVFISATSGQDRTGYEFLKNEVSARAAGIGGAFVAVKNDISSLFYNPAGIAFIKEKIGSVTYFDHLIDFKGGTIIFGKPVDKKYVIGIGLNFIDYGNFEGRDEFGNETGSFSANNIVLNVGTGINYSEIVKFGISGKIIYSKIAGYSSDAYSLDFGSLYYIPSQEITVGLSFQNLGFVRSGYIDYKDRLPFQVRAGINKKMAHLPLLISFETRYFNSGEYQFNLGGEFTFSDNFFGRIGYNSFGKDQKLVSGSDQLAGLSLGFGITYRKFIIDFAFASYGSIGSQNRFTLSRKW